MCSVMNNTTSVGFEITNAGKVLPKIWKQGVKTGFLKVDSLLPNLQV